MNWFTKTMKRFQSFDVNAPLIFLVILLITYGFYILSWGFYWDDWPVILFSRLKGDFWLFYQADRPLSAWSHVLFTNILQSNPVAWQITFLILRWFIVVSFWWFLRLVWPKAKTQTFFIALLFSIYPTFLQQAIAVTYIYVCIGYLVFFLSLIFMVLAIKNTKKTYFFTILSLLLGLLHMVTVEYYWGLELIRLPIIFILLIEKHPKIFNRLKTSLSYWLPYFFLFFGVFIWRFFILHFENDRNKPIVLLNLLKSPKTTVLTLFEVVLKDCLHILANIWFKAIDPETIQLNSKLSLASWGLAILIIVLCFVFLSTKSSIKLRVDDNLFNKQAFLVGIFSLFMGMIPVWFTGRQVSLGLFSDRFSIPALVGACLIIVSILNILVPHWPYKVLIFSIIIGMAVGILFRSGNGFRQDWSFQKDFYWQLYWRAPAIEPGTALFSEGGIFQYTAKYSLSTAINMLYPVQQNTTELRYWTYEMDNFFSSDSVSDLIPEGDLIAKVRTMTFNAPRQNSIVLSYERNIPHCLWVLSTSDAFSPYLGKYTEKNLILSNLDRILPEPTNSEYPDETIFGPEPDHTWCYYFQKADLARQMGDWEKVVALGDQVIDLEFGPGNSIEWIPFIEGYIHLQNWEKAQKLTDAAYKNNEKLDLSLCAAWQRAITNTSLQISEKDVVNSIEEELDCTILK